MDWGGSLDGEGTDYSTTSSPPRTTLGGPSGTLPNDRDAPPDDSLSDDELSDDFSLQDSDDEDARREGS